MITIEPDRWTGNNYNGQVFKAGFTNTSKTGEDYVKIANETYKTQYFDEIWNQLKADPVLISQTDAGDYHVSADEIRSRINLPETDNYYVTLYVRECRLEINPAELTVTTGSDSKIYDGAPLTMDQAELAGFVEDETASATATGTITDVGTADNTYAITWDTAKESNYTIKEELGTLTVRRHVAVTAVLDDVLAQEEGVDFTFRAEYEAAGQSGEQSGNQGGSQEEDQNGDQTENQAAILSVVSAANGDDSISLDTYDIEINGGQPAEGGQTSTAEISGNETNIIFRLVRKTVSVNVTKQLEDPMQEGTEQFAFTAELKNGTDPVTGSALESGSDDTDSFADTDTDSSAESGNYPFTNGSLVIDGGQIRNCSATQSGGGIYNKSKTIEFRSGSIVNCTANLKGGGVYNTGSNTGSNNTGSSFTMAEGCRITGCSSAEGGGVYIVNNTGKSFAMTGGSITGNTATVKGGGIAIEGVNSRIYFSGTPEVSGNKVNGTICNVELWSAEHKDYSKIINSNGLDSAASIGIYVLQEKKAPAGYTSSQGRWFYLIIDSSGASMSMESYESRELALAAF